MLPLLVSSGAVGIRGRREHPKTTLTPKWLGTISASPAAKKLEGRGRILLPSLSDTSDRFEVDSCQRPTEGRFARARFSARAAVVQGP